MAEKPAEMSVAEIQRLLKAKQSKVNTLQKKRESLVQKLEEVDEQIAELTGGGETGARYRNEKSLQEVIVDVLKKHKKGLPLAELTAAIEETGYQSSSANFKNVVYQNLYKSEEVTRDEKTGRYVLA